MPDSRIEKIETQDELDNINELVPLRYRERLNR